MPPTVQTTAEEQQPHQQETFRNYADGKRQKRVENFYATKYRKQNVEWNVDIRREYSQFNKAKMSIWDALLLLNSVVDESDPDVDVSQINHAMQTAEACRRAAPQDDWFHLLGLIHDLGKVLATEKFGKLQQHEVVGDIYPVGCEFDLNANVLPQLYDRDDNDCPDRKNPAYNTKFGLYQKLQDENGVVGLDKVMMTFSHDEYMYMVLKNHPQCTLPEEALYCIRYHSFYPWHNKGGYMHLANEKDMKMLPCVQKFQKCDLYSKVDEEMNYEDLEKYYKGLIEKYIPGVLNW